MRTRLIQSLILLLCSSSSLLSAAEETGNPAPAPPIPLLQEVVDEMRKGLRIEAVVMVEAREGNHRLASVEPLNKKRDNFRLSLDPTFLETLSTDELRAVIAHELGHVWIFTHHPYLQTEELANEIAGRLIDSSLLHQVYRKVEAFQSSQEAWKKNSLKK